MDLDVAFAIPLKVVTAHLDALNTTTTSKKTYWHIHIVEDDGGKFAIPLRNSKQLSIDQFKFAISK